MKRPNRRPPRQTAGSPMRSDRAPELREIGERLSRWQREQGDLTRADETALFVAHVALAYLNRERDIYHNEKGWQRDHETADALGRAWRAMRGRNPNDVGADLRDMKIRGVVGAVVRTVEGLPYGWAHLGWDGNRDAFFRELADSDSRFATLDAETGQVRVKVDEGRVREIVTRERTRGNPKGGGPAVYAIVAELFALVDDEISSTNVRDAVERAR